MTLAKSLCERRKRTRRDSEMVAVEPQEIVEEPKRAKTTKAKNKKSEDNREVPTVTEDSDTVDGKKKKEEKGKKKEMNSSSDTEHAKSETLSRSDKKKSKKRKHQKIETDANTESENAGGSSGKKNKKGTGEVVDESTKTKKTKDNKKKKNAESDQEAQKLASESAIEYLHLWKKDKSAWRFRKVRQVWLLKHVYDTSTISEEDFIILLEYLEGLQGMSRQKTVEKAEELMNKGETSDDDKGDKPTSTTTEMQLERARQILQLLT